MTYILDIAFGLESMEEAGMPGIYRYETNVLNIINEIQ